MKGLIVFAAVIMVFTSCSKPPSRDCNGGTIGDSVRIRIAQGGSASAFDCYFRKVVIHFVKVEDDSRCPSQVVCVWGGAAGISLTINDDKTLIPVRLDSTSLIPVNQDIYLLKFEKLDPYPTGSPINAADYKATLFLQRKK